MGKILCRGQDKPAFIYITGVEVDGSHDSVFFWRNQRFFQVVCFCFNRGEFVRPDEFFKTIELPLDTLSHFFSIIISKMKREYRAPKVYPSKETFKVSFHLAKKFWNTG